MRFAQVIGQERAKAQLLQLVQTDKLPHALMLLGPPGVGKRTLALALAQYLWCENRGSEDACGECPSCQKMEKLEFPDLQFSYPVIKREEMDDPPTSDVYLNIWRPKMLEYPYFDLFEWVQTMAVAPLYKDKKRKGDSDSKPEGEDGKVSNKQANIYKAECNEIVRKISLKSFSGRHKVLLLWLPEYLDKEGNSLLKIIEEPPADTIFILVAENPDRILPTIISRCQIIRVGAIADEAIAEGLMTRVKDMTKEKAWQLALPADGNFHKAMQLATTSAEVSIPDVFINWLRACYRPRGAAWLKTIDDLAELGRESQKHLMTYGLHFLREALVHSLSDRLPIRLQGQEFVTAQKIMASLDPERIDAISEVLSKCQYHIERNANAKVMFFNHSMQIHRIMHRIGAYSATVMQSG